MFEISFTSEPVPLAPRWNTWLPSRRITGSARARSPASPPTMNVTEAARAPSVPPSIGSPPDSGASR